MAFIPMPASAGAHVCSEGHGSISIETVVIKSGSGMLAAGSVLGRITAAGADYGKYVLYDNAATDGRQIAAGALFAPVDATSADVHGVAHVRLCELYVSLLSWAAGTTEAAKVAAYSDFSTNNIITRN